MARNIITKITVLAALALPRFVLGAQGDICYMENLQGRSAVLVARPALTREPQLS